MSASSSASGNHRYAQRVLVLAALLSSPVPLVAEPSFVQHGTAGFVLSELRYALADDAEKTGACRRGMSLNVAEIFTATPAGKRHKGESDKDYGERLEQGGKQLSTAPNGQNL